jgi:hypothetical protein
MNRDICDYCDCDMDDCYCEVIPLTTEVQSEQETQEPTRVYS